MSEAKTPSIQLRELLVAIRPQSPQPRAELGMGRRLLSINAHDWADAEGLACDGAATLGFEEGRAISRESLAMLAAHPQCPASDLFVPGQGGRGAWIVDVARIVVSTTPDGFDVIHVLHCPMSLAFVGERPHDDPEACDDPLFWRAARLALDEKEAMGLASATAPASELARPARRAL